MRTSQLIILMFITLIVTTGCKSKKKPVLSGEEPIEIADFLDFFPKKSLPYDIGDTTLARKPDDSLLINRKIVAQFIPDSVVTMLLGKNNRSKLYAMGRVEGKNEKYLFVKTILGEKRSAAVIGFDNKDQFVSAMPLFTLDQNSTTQQLVSLDTRYGINKTTLRKNRDGSVSEGRDVYGLNVDAKKFILFMTDPLEESTELINPIDTLTKKHKFTADYSNNKSTLISIRDNKKTDRINFFIHFEINNGECKGELKGEATLKSATTAEYRQGGDPCVLQFIFTASGVTLKEIEGCGSRRGVRCSFDGTYTKKKEIKPKKVKK